MVRAKGNTTQRHALFEPSMSAQTMERVELESDLRSALERGELRVHYQPIVTLESTEIVGFEALVRWQHPTRGLVPPLAFIPLAEETGLIVPARAMGPRDRVPPGREVAGERGQPWTTSRCSCRSTSRRASSCRPTSSVTSRTCSRRPAWTPAALELEITESVLMDHSETGIRTLRRLRALGVRLVLDDFGTGLFVAVVSQAPAARHDQDRPLVRRRYRGEGGPLDRRGGRGARPRPRDRRRRGGHRDRAPGRAPARAGLRPGPGLPVQSTRTAAKTARLLRAPTIRADRASPRRSERRSPPVARGP